MITYSRTVLVQEGVMRMSRDERKSYFAFLICMLIFGSIGIFRRNISLSSPSLSLVRSVLGILVICSFMIIKKSKINRHGIKKNLIQLLLSGALMGINWILLFEAYQFTSISIATVGYYMQPTILLFLSPFFLNERISKHRLFLGIIALIGMLLLTNLFHSTGIEKNSQKGLFLAVSAAVCYAFIIIINKSIDLPSMERTLFQFLGAVLILFPYVLFTTSDNWNIRDAKEIIFILIVGILNTGIAYLLYFYSISKMKAQSISILSYLDPLFALALSVLVLKESMNFLQIIGSALILGSAIFSESKIFQKKFR